MVALEMIKLGGRPVYRNDFITDNGNIILDVHGLEILEPMALEQKINNIPGVVTNGLFAMRSADNLLISGDDGIKNM
jgi:ribose 5-phosphate isomerase A